MVAIKDFCEIMDLAKFPEEAKAYLEELYADFCKNDELIRLADETEELFVTHKDTRPPRNRIYEITGMNSYSADMLLLIYFSVNLRKRYAERGYSESFFCEMLKSLNCKLYECINVYGIYGTFVFGSFRTLYTFESFFIGRLQYEDRILGFDYKDIAKKGDRIVGLHIPSTGPLTPELVDESLARAYEFYKPDGDGYLVLHCHSWMIYPPLYELFPENSNLRKFYHRFDIVSVEEDERNDDLWRIFNTMDTDISKYPLDTALRRNFYEYIKSGKKMGYGVGIIAYKPEK